MTPNLLILGGTTEARRLCSAVARAGLTGTVSVAGRVDRPAPQALPLRVGGFGGVAGLVDYLHRNDVTHLIDATHPFAAQMSANAVAACAETSVPLLALTRAPWQAQPGDRWQHMPDIAGAVAALNGPKRRVMLAVGRMHLAEFAAAPQHFHLLRLVDAPDGPLPLPDCHAVVGRGPFTVEGDMALMRYHRIEIVVSKNAGGTGAQAKIVAARRLGLPVIMIDRPAIPPRRETHSVDDVMRWLGHGVTDLGV
ncbi:MAG: cobalt-precorrin-6A reductase [Roseovarius sp.]|uniref:cobalt-precorrin-6A reductase n=1 Tax=Roseovarius sp. TaxID=1486281 RepID=UPI004059E801